MKVSDLHALEIGDSRGMPTLECVLTLANGQTFYASVPSGISVNAHEAVELRDEDPTRFYGYGVYKAREVIHKIIKPLVIDQEPDYKKIDQSLIEVDGTLNKAVLGSNSILAVSCAVAKAQAYLEGLELFELFAYSNHMDEIELPRPWFNVINGGVHANNALHIQEFLIVPTKALSFQEAYEDGRIFFLTLKELLQEKGLSTAVGDQGGFAPLLEDDFEAIALLVEALNRLDSSRYQFAFDIAANQLYDSQINKYRWYDTMVSADQLKIFYNSLVDQLPICALEDPFAQQDWHSWTSLSKDLQDRCLLIGDDLFATQSQLISYGSSVKAAHGALIKPNQLGTLTEAFQAVQITKDLGLMTIASHRSGETEDTWLADFSVGSYAKNIKAGGCCRSEQTAKYNRLLQIEHYLATNFSH